MVIPARPEIHQSLQPKYHVRHVLRKFLNHYYEGKSVTLILVLCSGLRPMSAVVQVVSPSNDKLLLGQSWLCRVSVERPGIRPRK